MSLRGAKRRSNLITLKFIQMKPGFVYIMTNKNNTGGENQFIIIGVQVGVLAMALYIYIYFKLIKTGLQQLKITAGKEWKIILAIVLIKIGMFIPMFTSYIDSYIYLSYFSWFLSGYMINHIQNRQLITE